MSKVTRKGLYKALVNTVAGFAFLLAFISITIWLAIVAKTNPVLVVGIVIVVVGLPLGAVLAHLVREDYGISKRINRPPNR